MFDIFKILKGEEILKSLYVNQLFLDFVSHFHTTLIKELGHKTAVKKKLKILLSCKQASRDVTQLAIRFMMLVSRVTIFLD